MISFRSAAALLGVLALFPAGEAVAAPSACSTPLPAVVNVEPVYEDVTYDFHQSMMKIKQMANEGSDPQRVSRHATWPIGLATANLMVRIATQIQTKRNPYDGTTCGTLKGVSVQLGFTNNGIYVAREFPSRSCPFKEVLAHEEKHKAVDRAVLEQYMDRAKEFFTQAVANLGVIQQHDGAEVEAEFNKKLNDQLTSFVEEMGAERARLQTLVDSPEEYARVSAACDGQVSDIVSQRLELLEESRGSGIDATALSNRSTSR